MHASTAEHTKRVVVPCHNAPSDRDTWPVGWSPVTDLDLDRLGRTAPICVSDDVERRLLEPLAMGLDATQAHLVLVLPPRQRDLDVSASSVLITHYWWTSNGTARPPNWCRIGSTPSRSGDQLDLDLFLCRASAIAQATP